MSENHNTPVRVTGEERRHPAIRTLARACIEIARLRLEQKAATERPNDKERAQPAVPEQEGRNV